LGYVFVAVEDFRLHWKPELPGFRDLSRTCFRGGRTDVGVGFRGWTDMSMDFRGGTDVGVDKGKPSVSDGVSFGFGSSLCSAVVFRFFDFWSNFSSYEVTMRRLLVVRFLRFEYL
jgi:hypothetical protein